MWLFPFHYVLRTLWNVNDLRMWKWSL
jgi:hypothetical protein